MLKHDLSAMILYESFIPIDALVFEIGTSHPSTGEIDAMVEAILTAKRLVLANASTVAKFFNTSEIINEGHPISDILKFRHSLMRKDRSSIFKKLVRNSLHLISECVRERIGVFRNDQRISDPERDSDFRKMVLRLREAVSENLDIGDRISKEREEFYRAFKKLPGVRKGKISLNLGGSILNPRDMLELISKIDAKDKPKAVREWVNSILEPIEALQMNSMKGFVEQKFIVLDFLKECLERRLGIYDSAFEARSQILRAAKLSDAQIQNVLARQERECRRLLELVENMRDDQWIIRYNRQIKEDYVNYLLTLQQSDKSKIINHFKD